MPILSLQNLTKKYGNFTAVDELTFDIKKGELFGLLGPNGAGKTTTISLISTLLKPTSGKVLYQGKDILASPVNIQKELGYIPQDIALYSQLSAWDNLMFFGKMYKLSGNALYKKCDEVLELMELSQRKKDPIQTFSGGMKRRLNIGVALLHDPSLLIMDEPTVGIDPHSRNYILDSVKKLNEQGMTVIYTSHYMEEVEQICSKILIMDQGRKIAYGTKDELLKSIEEGDTINMTLRDKLLDAKKDLEKTGFIRSIDVMDNQLKIHTKKETGGSQQIIKFIADRQYTILSIEIKQPSLESVFLNLTGKTLRD